MERKISVPDFLMDTANQLEFYLQRISTVTHDIYRDAADCNLTIAQQIQTRCDIITCDLDDLDDIKDWIWKYREQYMHHHSSAATAALK